MKATEKIYDALRICTENKEENPDFQRIGRILTEFIIANDAPKRPKGGPDIWKFVSKDHTRPVMTGVCYIPSMKSAVACDMINMLISKPDYVERETNNGVRINGASEPCGIYRKDGTGVTKEDQSSDYPAFLSVIPKEETQKPATMNDRDAVAKAIKEAKIAIKAKTASRAMIQVAEGIWMRPESAELMLTMPEWKYACDKGMPGKRAITYRDDNYTALFMPIIKPESDYKTTVETDGILALVK